MTDKNWPIIRQDLVDRVGGMETSQAIMAEQLKHIMERLDRHGENQKSMYGEFRDFMTSFNTAFRGDNINPGYVQRVRTLEEEKEERKKATDNIVKVSIGAATISVGAAVLWIFKVVIAAFK